MPGRPTSFCSRMRLILRLRFPVRLGRCPSDLAPNRSWSRIAPPNRATAMLSIASTNILDLFSSQWLGRSGMQCFRWPHVRIVGCCSAMPTCPGRLRSNSPRRLSAPMRSPATRVFYRARRWLTEEAVLPAGRVFSEGQLPKWRTFGTFAPSHSFSKASTLLILDGTAARQFPRGTPVLMRPRAERLKRFVRAMLERDARTSATAEGRSAAKARRSKAAAAREDHYLVTTDCLIVRSANARRGA